MGGDAPGGVAKVLAKLEKQVAGGNFYEAQQMYKTVFHRNRTRKKMDDALHLLQAGACSQLEHGQITCGEELATLLAQTYMDDSIAVDSASLGRVRVMLASFASAHTQGFGDDAGGQGGLPPVVASAQRFMRVAIKWSLKAAGKGGKTSPELHDMMADFLWESLGWQGLGLCTPHFIRGSTHEGPRKLAAVLHACAKQGQPEEEEMFLSRGMLQFLAAGDAGGAEELMEAYGEVAGSRGVLETPLVHCAHFLVQAVLRDSEALYRKVQEQYQPALSRDPSLSAAADRAGAAHWGGGGSGGLMGDLMAMLMGGDDEE